MTALTHPERVAAAVPDDCKVVALLHDAVEDGHLPYRAAAMALDSAPAEALWLLTRDEHNSYAEYIDQIARLSTPPFISRWGEPARIARLVKIADLRDNLYGRPEGPPPDSLRRRYEKALMVLEEKA
jgi:hypothetical protein